MDFNEQYEEVLEDIIENGISNEGQEVRTVWKDGEPAHTKSVWVRSYRMQPEDGFPILRKKFVNPKSFASEILWIMQKASNLVADARDLGTNVWNEWENEEGTIGASYGYQIGNNKYRVESDTVSPESRKAIGKSFIRSTENHEGGKDYYVIKNEDGKRYVYLNQMDYVIHQLIDKPSSRQTVTTLMNPREHHLMELPPCVWASHWEVLGGKLHLSVVARSSDTFLGLPFNVSQYALLHRLIAHVTGHELGEFVLTSEDAHLYDRHIPIAQEYLKRERADVNPEMWIDEKVNSFQEFEYEKNFGFTGYSREDVPSLRAPIAIGRGELERLREEEKGN